MPSNEQPTAEGIAMACAAIQDYTPIAELAKSACSLADQFPDDMRWVAGLYMKRWQAKIFEAQILSLLGEALDA